MPIVNVIPSWQIHEVNPNQVLTGTLSASHVYQFTLKRESNPDETETLICSVKDVLPVFEKGEKDDSRTIVNDEIFPSIIFTKNGFISDSDVLAKKTFKATEVVEKPERIYVRFASVPRDQRPRSYDVDPFIFNFINPKNNKPFRLSIDKDNFVAIPAETDRGIIRSNYGYIDHVVIEDGTATHVVMNSIVFNHGIFYVKKTTIPYTKIRGVYHNTVELSPFTSQIELEVQKQKVYDEAMAKEAAKKAEANSAE